jgi:hypothetical protein
MDIVRISVVYSIYFEFETLIFVSEATCSFQQKVFYAYKHGRIAESGFDWTNWLKGIGVDNYFNW